MDVFNVFFILKICPKIPKNQNGTVIFSVLLKPEEELTEKRAHRHRS